MRLQNPFRNPDLKELFEVVSHSEEIGLSKEQALVRIPRRLLPYLPAPARMQYYQAVARFKRNGLYFKYRNNPS